MKGARPRVVLASASPRRRALLLEAGLSFTVEPAGVDETLPEDSEPLAAAQALAERKARAVAERLCEPALVLGADTLVVLEPDPGAGRRRREFLGKPASAEEAAGMLRRLSASRHSVITGVCVVRTPRLATLCAVERTWVSMRAISPAEITAYVASGEWQDKAGGYAIQEGADRFVTRLEGGGFDNVVGLPVSLALGLLARAEALP